MKTKSGVFFLIDSLRHDVVADLEKNKKLYPNLYKVYKKSSSYHCVSNSRSTQFVLPSLFSLSYPLDYGGYDTGIRNRPLSFVELLRSKKYYNMMISNCNQIGVTNGYERGFDELKTAIDFKTLLEQRIARTIKPRLLKNKDIEFAKQELHIFFDELIEGIESYDKELWTSKLLINNLKIAEGFKKEKKILDEEPDIVIKKIILISQGNYYKFLGVKKINRLSIFMDKFFSGVSWRLRTIINRSHKFFPFTWYGHITVRLSRFNYKIVELLSKLNKDKEKYFVYFHLMDLHDNRDISDPVFFLKKFKFFFKWLFAKLTKKTNRSFNYDLALMYIDELFAPIIKLIESKEFENTVFLFTSDHGSASAFTPKRKKIERERFLEMHTEDLEVPVVIMNDVKKLNPPGTLIDSMDTSAIFLSEMGIDQLPDFFKGEQFKSRDYIISEHGGRGTSDILYKDLYFTITTKKDKLFLILRENHLIPTAYFNLSDDPMELSNLVHDEKFKSEINKLVSSVIKDRKEVLEKRKYEVSYLSDESFSKMNIKPVI